MGEQDEIDNLEGVLDQLAEIDDEREEVTIGEAVKAVGQRAFGPILLVPGLIAVSPLSGVPGTPTAVGVMVLLITGQLLIGRSEFWMPQFVLRRSVSRERFSKALEWVRPVARFIDRLIKPRLTFLAKGPAKYVIAAFCLLLSLIAPLLEVLPFAISGAGAALVAFGLALIAEDGLLVILAFAFCLATATAIGIYML